ncbi:hypothetical protein PC129_g21849 [Phytophthora cactorum]|uniref:Uncharacterized protein n=2 Tax=Phytophthora cactorum TaxID=29920 RepID=A0A8T1EXG9_9STRA|nr:hypothetical protein Pcac1_g24422 [Phytophthora cactorum]KAG2795651.1 hypothetical protein PC111_g22062 [Phytophthora cactorum]KAG2796285.1 hypothetical protein PC112_g22273 [Phytophthora cactorum]KAG2822874.1 hypothetical protein PC113_g22269 [Phytophthora cactorum]KAG2875250.1 hypothetical protein PC114_g24834 [Phytophthora cactorum]
MPYHLATSVVNTGSSNATPGTAHANKAAASANKTSADTASGNKAPVLTIEDLLFGDAKSIDDTEAMLLTCGAKQLRTACYLRQLRIVKRGSGCNDHKMGYVALLLELKRSFAEMQRLGLEGGPAKEHVALAGERKTRHCMPRLLNVMFSDRFSNRFHEIDGRPSHQELDTNEAQGNAFQLEYVVDSHEN